MADFDSSLSAVDIIAQLDLVPHPEGGHYREIHRIPSGSGARSPGTSIYFLLTEDEHSHWHRIDATEIWHVYAGAPLVLDIADGGHNQTFTLGTDLATGERPQAIVPPHAWQSAHTTGAWTLCGCTVSPGFEFSEFELAAPDWSPPGWPLD